MKRGETKENSIELLKPNVEAEVYNNNRRSNWIYTYTPISKIKRIYRIRKIRTINVFLESLLLEFFPSLGIIVYLTSLGCPQTLYWFLSGPAVGAAQNLIWSYSSVFLPPMSTAIRAGVFFLWQLSMAFYIFHRHRVCLVDHEDLICRL